MAMGRPREFDVDKALDLALQVFWRKGYEGASMADLTETMGITKPSLYSAFGNKEELVSQGAGSICRRTRRLCAGCAGKASRTRGR